MRSRTVSGDAMKMAFLNKKTVFDVVRLGVADVFMATRVHGHSVAAQWIRELQNTLQRFPSASGKGVSRFRLAIGSMWVAFSGCQQLLGNSQIGLEEGPRLLKEGPESRRRGMVGI